MRALVIVGLVGVGACWHEASPATTLDPAAQESGSTARSNDDPAPTRHFHRPTGPDCFSLGPAMEQMFSRYPTLGPAMAEVLDAVTSSCVEDVWSLDMIGCFVAAADDKRAEDCVKMLSETQMQSLQRRLMEAMTRGVQSVPPPTPTP